MKISKTLLLAFLAVSVGVLGVPLHPSQTAHADIQSLSNPIDQNNWKVSWSYSGDYGLIITNVQYKGSTTPYETVITDARISNIYVDYPTQDTDLIDDMPDNYIAHLHKVNVSGGFKLEATYYIYCTESQYAFNPTGCYKYIQEWWFLSDGTFRPWLRIYGPGLILYNGDPIYETRWRLNTGILDSGDDGFAYYDTSSWVKPTSEGGKNDTYPYDANGNDWKTFDFPESGETFYVDPLSIDYATMWYLRQSASELVIPQCLGDSDCDNVNGSGNRGSPNYWVEPQTLQGTSSGNDIVLWYIARSDWGNLGCSTTAPCYPGGEWTASGFP